jgi:hypothetical protein
LHHLTNDSCALWNDLRILFWMPKPSGLEGFAQTSHDHIAYTSSFNIKFLR